MRPSPLPAVYSRLLGLMAWGVVSVNASCAPLPESEAEALGSSVSAVTGGNILFVGNSFTHGNEEPAYSYNKAAVTDTNGSGVGGIPGIFKKLTTQAGLSFNVSLETASGQSLAWHYGNRAAIIGQATWNTVVLQEQSTTPLPTARGGSPSGFTNAARDLRSLVLSKNPAANLFLYETWASPTSVGTQGYPSGTPGLQAMQTDLRDAYFKASRELGFTGVARVGDGFLRAVDQDLADPNPADGISAGMFNLWSAQDSRHSSRYGSYLSAAVLFAKITQLDPRSLATGTGSAAAGLGISAADASNMHRIAYEIVALPDPVVARTRLPVTRATFTGAVTAGTPVSITGGAQLASLTTEEGTFTNVVGATASGITGTNTPSSLGTVPANVNAAASGLGANDGANNVGAGNFQFGTGFSARTRFFIVESTLASAAVGDPTTVTLINVSNQTVGTYSLSLGESDFTATAAGNTSASLATLNYTGGVASVTGTPAGSVKSKLGAVSFSLADLGVSDVASVSGATGLRISSSTLDPNVVGLYTVP
ncbi:cell division protein FtsK [Corallococcus praedator]|uniref:Cell division protein FtsK n=1 Tax=Corallococcus praedator TaxID=2316724 RepID=A0ABX9QDZ1_9BACT|nr:MULTISPECIES: cell division protein FtsK [Corallococcus]RKH24080.1 cell division protein FtsK [Corallococcus sp. CA031C]RKI00708.1 cell division protein FtsK [Corallococcus praedator]